MNSVAAQKQALEAELAKLALLKRNMVDNLLD